MYIIKLPELKLSCTLIPSWFSDFHPMLCCTEAKLQNVCVKRRVSFLSSSNKFWPTHKADVHTYFSLLPYVFMSAHWLLKVSFHTDLHFFLPAGSSPPHLLLRTLLYFSRTYYTHAARTCIHTAHQRSPFRPRGLHRTICVGFLQLDFLFSYTLWLSDNLWWPC